MKRRPTKDEIAAAVGTTVPDLIAPGLAVLFCGINPGLYSGATGHHFARPGNRFWRTLQAAGFTDRLVRPWEERLLLEYGLGITNLVPRATASAAELGQDELRAGRGTLERKVRRYARERSRCSGSVRTGPPSAAPRPASAASRSCWGGRRCGCCRIRAASMRTTSSLIWRGLSGRSLRK